MSTQSAPPLELVGVTRRFGDFVAVDDISLTIEPGEIFALLGPNGAGKTTLISCITGIARQTEGTIRVFGHDTVSDYRTTRRLVGLVPQEINFDPFFTPHESLMIQMGLMGTKPDGARADALLETVALADKRDAYTRNLSGGMKRRLLVAKALAHRPKLLFLDEPTAGVDVELRQSLWDEIERLRHDEGTTIILTTHYLEEAEQLADRIGILNRGRLGVVSDRDTLMQSYGAKSVTITLAAPIDTLPGDLPVPCERVSSTVVRAQWTEPDDLQRLVASLTALGGVVDLRVEGPRLEDIFVDLVRSDERERAGASA